MSHLLKRKFVVLTNANDCYLHSLCQESFYGLSGVNLVA